MKPVERTDAKIWEQLYQVGKLSKTKSASMERAGSWNGSALRLPLRMMNGSCAGDA